MPMKENQHCYICEHCFFAFDQKKGETVVIAPNYSPCLHEITMEWNSGQLRLKSWLIEERK